LKISCHIVAFCNSQILFWSWMPSYVPICPRPRNPHWACLLEVPEKLLDCTALNMLFLNRNRIVILKAMVMVACRDRALTHLSSCT
jgi:hypothetical protein